MLKRLLGVLALVPVLGALVLPVLGHDAPVEVDALSVTDWNVTVQVISGTYSVDYGGNTRVLSPGSRVGFTVDDLDDGFDMLISPTSIDSSWRGYWRAVYSNSFGNFQWADDDLLRALPYWEGNCTIRLESVVNGTVPWWYGPTDTAHFVASVDYCDDVEVGQTYKTIYDNAYEAGRTAGYDAGYDVGVSYGRSQFPDVKQGVYFQWDTDYQSNLSYMIGWDADGALSEVSLSYSYPTVYFERSIGQDISIHIECEQGGGNIPFLLAYSASHNSDVQVLDSALAVNGIYYLPWWEGSITLRVIPITNGSITSYDLELQYGVEISDVRVLSSYASGYNAGYEAGSSAGYDSGVADANVAFDRRLLNAYDEGYDAGYRAGYEKGLKVSEVTNVQVFDIFPLISAIVSMPFTFMTQGLDWTLFQGTPYEFGVSAFIGTVFVVLMVWKIFKLVIGFGK